MFNKELLLCNSGADIPVKYEYTVDMFVPNMGLGGVQTGYSSNENVKAPYWGNESNYFYMLECENGYNEDLDNYTERKWSVINIASNEPVLGNTITLKVWLSTEYKEYVFTWGTEITYPPSYYINDVCILNWETDIGKKVILEFSVPPDGYIIK